MREAVTSEDVKREDTRLPAACPREYEVPHRKNAAEWVMWTLFLPLILLLRVLRGLGVLRG